MYAKKKRPRLVRQSDLSKGTERSLRYYVQHLPAPSPPPGPSPASTLGKGGRQIEKTHNTEGLGSENISMFFSNSIVNRKGFLPRPALFPSLDGDRNRRSASRCRVTGCRWSLLFGALGQRIAVYQRCLYSESGRRILCRRKLPCRIWHHL